MVIDHMRTACGTDNSVHQMTSVGRTFLRWCEEQGALTAKQVALLPAANAPARAPRFAQPTHARRGRGSRGVKIKPPTTSARKTALPAPTCSP